VTTGRRCAVTLALVASLALVTAGCGGGSKGDTSSAGGSSSSSAGSLNGAITVFAAASLTEAFTDLGARFEQAHPGVTVTYSFGPSSGLAEQITQGAPADVFASASLTNMTQVTDAGDAAAPKDFAKNVMEIAVPPGNPARVTGVDDLARSGVKVALCQAAVPCGSVAAQVFENAGIRVQPVTEETDVKAVLSKVTLGEVDAGMVYVTDVRSAGAKVLGVPVPDDVNASTSYPIATIKRSRNAAAAQAFMDFVLSPTGASALAAAGFQAP
jgi:molybdate transport system substrate-binding protein